MAINKTAALAVKNALTTALKAKGLPLGFLGVLMAQVAHETAGFKSNLTSINNFSGIKYYKQKGAFNSLKMSPEGDYYASYTYLSDWAADYLRILNKGGVNSPFNARSTAKFAELLKVNKYYTDSLKNYTAALETWVKEMKFHFPTLPLLSIGSAAQRDMFYDGTIKVLVIFFLFTVLK